MSKEARILIADTNTNLTFLCEALKGYDLYPARSTAEALRLIAEDGFDLIICGIHFDDSRMVELLMAVRKIPGHKATPFVVFRGSATQNEDLLRQSVNSLRKTLGVEDYLELDATPDTTSLRYAIEKYLPKAKIAEGV